MTIDLSWVKRLNFKTVGIILLSVLLIVGVLVIRDWQKAKGQVQYWKGVSNQLGQVVKAQEKQGIKDRSEATKTIADQNKEIQNLRGSIQGKDGAIAKGSKAIKDLEAAEKNITDKDALIVNLRAQIEEWKSQFNLSQSASSDKDAIIFAMTTKYNAQVKISATWQNQYLAERNVRLAVEKQLAYQTKANKLFSLENKVERTAIVAVIVYFGGKLLKVW